MTDMTGRLRTETRSSQQSIFLRGEDAVGVLQSIYPAELAWSFVPEDIEDCEIVMELPLAVQALTTMVDRLYTMRKSGAAAQRPHIYDALQAMTLRLSTQIYDTWEPPFEIPDIAALSDSAESQQVPKQPTAAEATVARQLQPDAAIPVGL